MDSQAVSTLQKAKPGKVTESSASCKEVIYYGVLVFLLWISSMTVLLPLLLLLKFNKKCRACFFAWLYKIGGETKTVFPYRRQLFEILEEKLKQGITPKPLQVLEIGIGNGANLEFYPEGVVLMALDANPNHNRFLEKKKSENPHITYGRTVCCTAENMPEVQDESMDVVISTYLFCSAEDTAAVLNEIKRVLKPGGKFLFLDHGPFPKGDWSYTVQRIASPLWRIYCDGCTMLRNPEPLIRAMDFKDLLFVKACPRDIWFFVRPQIWGIATK